LKRSIAFGALLVAVAAAVFVARADAILFGTPDGNDHRGVGYIVFYDATNTPLWRCTGSLVSRSVLLTAGHCSGTFPGGDGEPATPKRAQVWFDKQIKRSGNYPGSGPCGRSTGWPCTGGDATGLPFAHPDYHGDLDGTENDLGVVVLSKPQSDRDILDFAPLGTLERTKPGTKMTIVGFGNQTPTPPPIDERQRMQGAVRFAFIDDEAPFADFTNGPVAGGPAAPAAACVGDSGGPVLTSKDEIVAVIALIDSSAGVPGGDGFCQGVAYHTRTDTTFAKRFLRTFGVSVKGNDGDSHDGHHGHKHGRNPVDR
jgi:hypothetical protein